MGLVGAEFTYRDHSQKRGRQGKRIHVKGYNRRQLHVVLDDTSDEELPSTVQYATIVQEEPFVPDEDELFSEQTVQ